MTKQASAKDLVRMYQRAMIGRVMWARFFDNTDNVYYRAWTIVERKLAREIVARMEAVK